MSDSSLHKSNQMFSAMLKQLQREGLDRAKHHPSIYEGGGGNPKALQRKVWFDVMISFGPRGRGNQRYICFQNRYDVRLVSQLWPVFFIISLSEIPAWARMCTVVALTQ
jgi:hypothetical protein